MHLYEADSVAAVEIQYVIECSRKRLLSGPRNATGMSLPVLTPEINHVTLVCFIWHCHVTLYFLEVIQTQQKRIIKPGITQIGHVHCLGVYVSFLDRLLLYFKAAHIICCTKHENKPLGFFSMKDLNSYDRTRWGNIWTLL